MATMKGKMGMAKGGKKMNMADDMKSAGMKKGMMDKTPMMKGTKMNMASEMMSAGKKKMMKKK